MKATLSEMEAINPMISADGNTYKVSSALESLRHLFDQRQDVPLDEAQAFGVSVLLATCAAALRRVGEIKQ